MDLWQRFTQRHIETPPPPPAPAMTRDPDLDTVHVRQHDLMRRVSADVLRKSMDERRARLDLLDIQSKPRGEPHGC